MRAKGGVIHAADRSAAAIRKSGTTYFHVVIFSSISAFRIPTRVTTNSLSSSLVSASIVARDLSVCTVCPPDSQRHAGQKAHGAGGESNMHRIFTHCMVNAKSRAEI